MHPRTVAVRLVVEVLCGRDASLPLAASLLCSPQSRVYGWRCAAPATTKAPYKHRAAKREVAGAKPALPPATPHSSDCQPKEQHQPGAADATGNARQRATARGARLTLRCRAENLECLVLRVLHVFRLFDTLFCNSLSTWIVVRSARTTP